MTEKGAYAAVDRVVPLCAVLLLMLIRQPHSPKPSPHQHTHGVEELADLLRGRSTVVLSGAGLSTESGIPDYRGVDRQGPVRTPITYQQFVGSRAMRQRYWARSTVGWPAMNATQPNPGHLAVASLQQAGLVTGVITQNVDGLHQAAGSLDVVELHGALAQAVCLSCGRFEPRGELQLRLEELNPSLLTAHVKVLPDGDADIPESLMDGFEVPDCLYCGGMLKSDVVFFGENVPRPKVQRAFELLEAADVLLVLGSSLAVRSGYRFVAAAKQEGKAVGVVNHGPTRADADADVRVEGRLGLVLPALAELLI